MHTPHVILHFVDINRVSQRLTLSKNIIADGKIPLLTRLKSFVGISALTPFEQVLLDEFTGALPRDKAELLTSHMNRVNHTARLIRHIDVIGAHGFTEFHITRFGKPVLDVGPPIVDPVEKGEFARTIAKFDGGEIRVKFIEVDGQLFMFKYLSKQRTYYPPGNYTLDPIEFVG